MDVLDMFQEILSTAMIRAFFGGDCRRKTLEGKKLPNYISDLVADVHRQSQNILSALLGPKFLEMGLRESDRDINHRMRLFKAFASDLINSKMAELKERNFKLGDKKNGNMVEQIYLANQHSRQNGSNEDVYESIDIINEFTGFFFAGTDSTYLPPLFSSHLAALMLFYLERNPTVKMKAIEEVHSIIHSSKDVTNENLQKLPYLEGVRNETQRMYGPGNNIFPRLSTV